MPPTDTPAQPAIHCRQCGYMLAGLSEPRCPECGRRFDPERRSTFDRRPGAWRVRWWTRRLLAMLGPLALLVGGAVGWICWRYYPDWRAEQDAVRHWPISEHADFSPDGPAWLRKALGPFGYVMDRVDTVHLQEWAPVTRDDILVLRRFKRLTSLTLRKTLVTDDAMSSLSSGFDCLYILNLGDTRISDATLVHLRQCTNMWDLDVSGTRITDEGLKHLSSLKGLTVLRLRDTAVTDAGMAHLASHPQLAWLDLSNTRVTPQGLAVLKASRSLEAIWLSGPQVTDAWMPPLTALPWLRGIHLTDTQVTDSGLAGLSSLKRLTSLDLSGAQITDAGLANLAGLTNLGFLTLNNTQITDAGLVNLQGLRGLVSLDLSNTHVTDAGMASLAALPNLQQLYVRGTQVTTKGLTAFPLTQLNNMNTDLPGQ